VDIINALKISAAGMKAQGVRLRVLAENIANANSTSSTPGADPYRRKVVSFENVLDRETGIEMIRIDRISEDTSAFAKRYDPKNPAADQDGYIKLPNIKPLIEMMDFREAQRSYEANLRVLTITRSMIQRTIDMLRG
jgi:flagellar basal-body rod protein FlgC